MNTTEITQALVITLLNVIALLTSVATFVAFGFALFNGNWKTFVIVAVSAIVCGTVAKTTKNYIQNSRL